MAFARKHLNEGEEFVLDLHPHWIFLVPSLSSLLVILIVGIWFIVGTHDNVQKYGGSVVGIGVLIVLGWFIFRLLQWKTMEFAVTNYRVMSMSGILNKKGIQIPLDRINTVEYDRTLIERFVGAGDLVIESASNDGRQTFENIRHPDEVQRKINLQIQQSSPQAWARGAGGQPPVAATNESVADQLTKLDELRRNGVLSEAEFQAQKARLLQG